MGLPFQKRVDKFHDLGEHLHFEAMFTIGYRQIMGSIPTVSYASNKVRVQQFLTVSRLTRCQLAQAATPCLAATNATNHWQVALKKGEDFGDIEERIDISIGLIYPLPSNIVAFFKVPRDSIGKNCDNPGGDCEFGWG